MVSGKTAFLLYNSDVEWVAVNCMHEGTSVSCWGGVGFSILGGSILYNNLAMSVNFLPQYLWLGLQTTGNDPQHHRILEVSCFLSDGRMGQVHEGPQLVVRCKKEDLVGMDSWNLRYAPMHAAVTRSQDCSSRV